VGPLYGTNSKIGWVCSMKKPFLLSSWMHHQGQWRDLLVIIHLVALVMASLSGSKRTGERIGITSEASASFVFNLDPLA
jgi:hypothetical protein